MVIPFEEAFPGLRQGSYALTSPSDNRYNCIAYAAGDTANWWWPFAADVKEVFWPAGVARAETVTAFRDAFASRGFTQCAGEDAERGFEKVALFADKTAFPYTPPASCRAATGQANLASSKTSNIGFVTWRAMLMVWSC